MAKAKQVVLSQAGVIALISAAMQVPPNYYMATAEEIAAAGNDNLMINPEIQADGKTAVVLSDAGKALAQAAPAQAAPAAKPAFVLETGFELPKVNTGGGRQRESEYPFDQMEVGHSFFVPATEQRPDPAKSLASTVSGATARYAVETGETEIVTENVYAKGPDGKNIKDADGKWVKTGTVQVQKAKKKLTRQFAIRAVAADPSKNQVAGARIFRIA